LSTVRSSLGGGAGGAFLRITSAYRRTCGMGLGTQDAAGHSLCIEFSGGLSALRTAQKQNRLCGEYSDVPSIATGQADRNPDAGIAAPLGLLASESTG